MIIRAPHFTFELNFINIQDYHAEANGTPQLDDIQNWELRSATQSNGHTKLQFSRKLNTCDEDDVAITVSSADM